jgi:hypothetical protein
VHEEPLQVCGHAEHRGRPFGVDRCSHRDRVERSRSHDPAAGQQRADRKPQRSRVVERAEDQVDVVGAELPEFVLLGEQSRRVVGGEDSDRDALGGARRPAGHMHRARKRDLSWVPNSRETAEFGLVGNDQGRLQVGQNAGSLRFSQPRIQWDR